MDAQIPGQLDSKLKPLFGEAGLHVTSGLDPAIPPILKPIDSGHPQDAKVVAINCEKELGAVIAKADHLGQIETWYLLLRQTTVTYWQGHYMYWVRCKQTPGEKPSLGPDYSVKLGDGIFFIGQGLIPIASSSADGDVFLVRQGTIPWVDLSKLVRGHNGSGSCAPDGSLPNQNSGPVTNGAEVNNPQSPETAAHGEPLKELQIIFGEGSVLSNVRADDPRIPFSLAAGFINSSSANSHLLAVQCGPNSTGHLVAVVFHQSVTVQTFSDTNPRLSCVATRCGSWIVVWLKLQGPVPRNLKTGPLTWVAEGLIPIGFQGTTAAISLPPGTQIPEVRFQDIQWDRDAGRAFQADAIQQLHGDPFLPVRPRKFILNDLFLSELLLREFNLVYDRVRKSFRSFDAGSETWRTLARQEIFELVTKRLVRLAHDFPIQFPPSEVSPSRVRRLMWLMETQGAVEIPTDKQAVDRFFNEAVEPYVGAELTQDSSYAGLVTFCKVRKWPRCSRAYFDRAATKRFGKTSHYHGEKGTLRGRVG